MRKMFFYLSVFVSLVSFQACTDDDFVAVTIDFEDVGLNADSTLKTTSFTTNGMLFKNRFVDWGMFSSWSGFACSAKTDRITAGYTNDLSVYAPSAASGSKFAVFYYSAYDSISYCEFLGQNEYWMQSVMLNTNTYGYLSMKNGDSSAKQFAAGDWFKVTIVGYTANDIKTDSVDFYLADFRNGKSYICNTWTNVNLTKLAKVNKLTFRFSSTDNGAYGMNTPSYVCMDDLKYVIDNQKE